MMNQNEPIIETERGFIKGEIMFTIFENKADQFAIAKIKIHDTNEPYEEKEIVGKGHFAHLQQGTIYQFFGNLHKHSSYGLQYNVVAYESYVPKTSEGLIQYLSSDLFPGVGKKTAQSIVELLGDNAITEILEDPDTLFNIRHMKKKTIKTFISNLQENQGFEQVAVLLTSYGISLKMAQQLYSIYKEKTLSLIKENPYTFAIDIEGFGFPTADKIAQFNQISKTNHHRIQASCIYALQQSILDGHVYLPKHQCVESMKMILQESTISDDMIDEQIGEINELERIVIENDNLYLPSLFYAEKHFSTHVTRLMNQPIEMSVTDAELMKLIGKTEESEAISYGMEQFEAIKRAIHSKLMILTGGPGTGKTTVVKAILTAFASIHQLSVHQKDYKKASEFPFILAAPTGRAAKRLQQSTGMKAMTIHRLLGWDGNDYFEKNEHEQLSGKYIIIDEFSMVDTWLANHLFKAIPDDMQVLLVGDDDQLPSVGPGQVLADMLHSKLIPTARLTEIYRQKDGSKIIQLAHQIKMDDCSMEQIQNDKDFSFINCYDDQVIDVMIKVIQKAINKGIEFKNIQILAPMYKTAAGINAINTHIQQLVNPKSSRKRERFFNDVIYREGDRVIQLVNQPEDDVYNGDIGEIIKIVKPSENDDNEEQIVVTYDENDVVYTRTNYVNFTHAYCISIHKSQGSEFPIVILPVVWPFRRMLRKNLLYTAITRSKQSLIICGEKDAFLKGIQTKDANERYTTLNTWLNEKLQLDSDVDEKELSPFDFM